MSFFAYKCLPSGPMSKPQNAPALDTTEKPVTEDSYWSQRSYTVYYQVFRSLVTGLHKKPASIVDVSGIYGSYLAWFPRVKKRLSVSRKPFTGEGITSVNADFLAWRGSSQKSQIITSIETLERTPDPEVYASKLLRAGETVIVSVAYKWPEGRMAAHRHTMIDEATMLRWFKREPNFSYVCREIGSNADRLIQVYEPSVMQWGNLAERQQLLNEIKEDGGLTYSAMAAKTDFNQFRKPLKICASPEDFYSKFEKRDLSYSINNNGSILDIEINVRDPRLVVFFFSAAKDREAVKAPPYFSMRSVSETVNATCVFISDPIFYHSDKATVGWYGGSQQAPLQTILPKIIDFIVKALGAQRSMFFGGSGGGFASLYYSRLFPGSLAVVWNPQTNLANYFEGPVNDYAQAAFYTDKNDLSAHLTTDLAAFYSETKSDNTVVYMQTLSDSHVATHLRPFLTAKGKKTPDKVTSNWIDRGLFLHMTDWTQGHTSPPYKIVKYILEAFSDVSQSWNRWSIAKIMKHAQTMQDK